MDYMEVEDALKRANKGLPTMSIKGKQYVMVKDRVSAFRREFPSWKIMTDIVHIDDDAVVFKAAIMDDDGHIIATGHAREEEGSNNINRTSHVENCETSAIGRALACLGIGIDDSFGSADEIANATLQQGYITEREFRNLVELCKNHDKDMAWLLATAEAASGREITMRGYAKVVKAVEALGDAG